MSEPTIAELVARIDALSATVSHQAKVIAQTGQKLLEFQINDVKQKINQHQPAPPGGVGSPEDADDYVTNDDIVQLVGELQGQLDDVETRAIRRLFNVQLSKDDTRPIAPLTNKDGEEPPEVLQVPQTYNEFAGLDKKAVLELAIFYEIVVPNQKELAALSEAIEGATEGEQASLALQAQQAHAALHAEVELPLSDETVDTYEDKEVEEIKDALARYLGLTWRGGEGW